MQSSRLIGPRVLNLAYAGLLLGLLSLGWGFSRTQGFVYGHGRMGALLFTHELLSSGANDNFNFEAGSLLFLLPLILLIALRQRWPRTQTVILAACWIIQGFLMLTLDAASIWRTVFEAKNMILMLWICCYIIVPPVFMASHSSRREE
jgi:hypothetical protein